MPSTSPSARPSLIPSKSPTSEPSVPPTVSPCIAYNGTYGEVSGNEKFYAYYDYGIEINNEVMDIMGESLSEVISDLEFDLLNRLVGIYFCNNINGKRRKMLSSKRDMNDFFQRGRISKRNLSQLVGLSSKPNDIANGETCDIQDGMKMNNDCFVIEGRLSLSLSDYDILNTYQSQISVSIKSIMDDGLLDDCHPAVVKVTFLDIGLSDDIDFGFNNVTADDNVENREIIIIFGSRTWIAMCSGVSLLFGLIVLTRYRYTTSNAQQYREEHNDANAVDDSNNSSAFIDITSNYQMYNINEEEEED